MDPRINGPKIDATAQAHRLHRRIPGNTATEGDAEKLSHRSKRSMEDLEIPRDESPCIPQSAINSTFTATVRTCDPPPL